MKTVPKVKTRPASTGALSSGAGEYPKTRQFEYESMRMGQTVAFLGARCSPHEGALELVEPVQPDVYRPKQHTNLDEQSIELMWPLGRHDRDALVVRVGDRLALDESTADTLFELLTKYWVDDTQFDSSFETMLSHPAARGLIDIGRPVVRFALRRLDAEPERWSYVLAEITGAQPIPPDAQREDAIGLWAEWLERNGWI